VIILPSAFTMANLFFGIWAIVAAAEGQLIWAGWFIIFSGILDMLDGRIARFTRTGSGFGAELDSLVDAISFGVAPGMILYYQFYAEGAWSWLISFIYVSAVVVRLARFNVEQSGGAKRYFLGLPSTTAGMTLAAFYPFSQTPLFQAQLATLPWAQIMGVVTILLCALLLSHIPYAKVPRISFGSARGIFTSIFLLAAMITAITVPRYYFFPALAIYILWGLVKAFLLGLQEGVPETDPLLEDDDDGEDRPIDYGQLSPDRSGTGGLGEESGRTGRSSSG
jgi:CDP-diacylglycerol--serine O-phosphatidyltransferase